RLTVPLTGANYVTPRTPRPPSAKAVSPPDVGGLPKVAGMPDADPNALAQALQMTQQSLAALQRMQEQTAALHKQFLESQEAAQRTLQGLVEQQQPLLLSGLGVGVAFPAVALPPLVSPAPESSTIRQSDTPHSLRASPSTPQKTVDQVGATLLA